MFVVTVVVLLVEAARARIRCCSSRLARTFRIVEDSVLPRPRPGDLGGAFTPVEDWFFVDEVLALWLLGA